MLHPSDPSATAWLTAPERDFLACRLIGRTELHLNAYFADPAGIEAYQRPSRRTSGRGKAAAPRALAAWEREGATLALAALPAAETFQVSLPNPLFSAILRVRHLPEEGGLRAATLEQFSGNIGAALAAASDWLDADSDLPKETVLRVALEGLVVKTQASSAAADAPGERAGSTSHTSPAGPPAPAAAHIRDVNALVHTVAAELRRNGAPSLDTASNAWLENRPQSLWPLPDAAVAASMARKRDEGGRPVPLAAGASSRICRRWWRSPSAASRRRGPAAGERWPIDQRFGMKARADWCQLLLPIGCGHPSHWAFFFAREGVFSRMCYRTEQLVRSCVPTTN